MCFLPEVEEFGNEVLPSLGPKFDGRGNNFLQSWRVVVADVPEELVDGSFFLEQGGNQIKIWSNELPEFVADEPGAPVLGKNELSKIGFRQ